MCERPAYKSKRYGIKTNERLLDANDSIKFRKDQRQLDLDSEKIGGKEVNRVKQSSIDYLDSICCKGLQGILIGGSFTVTI
jgi:hypothetical protein